jgi:hypothetical protein
MLPPAVMRLRPVSLRLQADSYIDCANALLAAGLARHHEGALQVAAGAAAGPDADCASAGAPSSPGTIGVFVRTRL